MRVAPGEPARIAPRSARLTTRLKPALWFLLALAAVYGVAVCSAIGQSAENALIAGHTGQAAIFHWSQPGGLPPLKRGSAAMAAGIVLIAALALLRRRWREGAAGIGLRLPHHGHRPARPW